MKKENEKWLKDNSETVVGQLVLYHSPVDLAHIVLNPHLWNDTAVEKMRRTLEKSEGLLKVEKKERKKVAVAAKKEKKQEVVAEEDEEANLRFIEEKQKESEAAFIAKANETALEDELPD